MRTSDQTRALFDRWAASYDRDLEHPVGILEGYQTSLQAAAESVHVPPGARLLDIGIGTGTFAALVAERGQAQVFGLDVSAQMLDQCRVKHPDYQLQIGSFNPIPHEDTAFDVVLSSFAYHETTPDERAAACQEMARVLKQGGVLCLLDILFASSPALDDARERMAAYWDSSEVYALVGELDADLRAAGFRALLWQQTAPCHWFVTARR